jgi:OTU domain-containing protein 5
MDYVELQKEFFRSFVPEDYPSIDHYIEHKRRNGVWGDNIEVQVLSELYDAQIEIYTYSNVPMVIIGHGERILRVSYHQGSHYNSIIPKDTTSPKDWMKSDEVGYFENKAFAKLSVIDGLDSEEMKEDSEFMKEVDLLRNDKNMIALYRKAVEESRQGFINLGQRDFESALQESLVGYSPEDEEAKAIEISKETFENEQNEQEMLNKAIEDSLTNPGIPNLNDHQQDNSSDQALQAAMLASMMANAYHGYNRNELLSNPIVQNAIT